MKEREAQFWRDLGLVIGAALIASKGSDPLGIVVAEACDRLEETAKELIPDGSKD